MTTQTKVFDFSYLVNKKNPSNYNNHDAKNERDKSFLDPEVLWTDYRQNLSDFTGDFQRAFPNKFSAPKDTYFYKILEYFDRAIYLGENIKHCIPFETIEVGKKFSITYTTHNEPKEYIMGVYIGKETGNIYLSNQGEDIIIGKLSDIIDVPFNKVINIFQQIKLTADYSPIKNLIDGGKKLLNSNPYLSIFSQTNNEVVVSTGSKVEQRNNNLKELNKGLHALRLYGSTISYCIKFAQYCMSYNIGRVSKVSDDMYDLIADFSPISYNYDVNTSVSVFNEGVDEFLNSEDSFYSNPDGRFFERNLLFKNTEYGQYSSTRYYMNADIDDDYSQIKVLLHQSIVDNMAGDESLFSEDTRNKLKSIVTDKNIDFNYNLQAVGVKIAFRNLSANDIKSELLQTEVMYSANKTTYKYLQRLHKIVEKL